MSVVDDELIEALIKSKGYDLSVSGDIAHKLEDDNLGVRVFSDGVVEVISCESRKEVTIVMEQADLNYSIKDLFSALVDETVNSVVDAHVNDKGGMNTTKMFKKRLKKELIIAMSKRLNQ